MDSTFDPKTNLVELLNNMENETINPLQLMKISNKYYDSNSLSGQIKTLNKCKLKTIHLNIHSLPDKFDKLKLLLISTKLDPDVILLCETFLNNNNENLYQLNGYQFISKSRVRKACGGVAMYIKNELNFKIRNDLSPHVEGTFESILIETINENKRYIIGEIYRPPNTNEQLSINYYEETLNNIQNTNMEAVIGTDQNFCYLKINQNLKIQGLLNTFFNNNFTPTIIMPTRITHNTATLIDNLYLKTKPHNTIKSGLIISDISDHLPIFLCVGSQNLRSKQPKTIITRQMNDEKLGQIKNELSQLDWNEVHNMNTNEAHNHFINKLNEITDNIAPEKEIIISRKHSIKEKWMTKGLLQSALKKEYLYKKVMYKPHNNPQYLNYIKYRNLFYKLKRITKSKFYADQIEENKNDMKNTWKIMKTAMNKLNDKSHIPQLLNYKNEVLSNDKDISTAFCDFFTNIGPAYANKIPKSKKQHEHYMKLKAKNSIFLYPTDPDEIDKIIMNLKPKSSSGHDNINAKFIKYLKDELKVPISILANKSLTEGLFPETYKLAEVVPIHKNKSKDDINNYRPISLLPTVSKILEKLLHKRVYKFLIKNKILYNSQYGFRPNHSTNNAITELITDVTNNLEEKSNSLSIFLDLSKAFDTIDHKILLKKLSSYGIRGPCYKWFESYLLNRSQYVRINKTKSTIKEVTCGVPQGSVLGPLLFIIYTNDLPNSLTHTHAILFADDTTIYTKSKNLNELYNIVNSDLQNLYDWFNANKLSLNISKTNYMLFTNHDIPDITIQNLEIKIGAQVIERKKNLKFLGVQIDENLNWHEHITNTMNKVAKTSYSIKMVKNILPKQNLKTLYQTLILPHLDYGILFWGGTHESHINKLVIQQKKIIRMITNSKYNDHTDPLFKGLKLLKLKEIHKLNAAKLMYKVSKYELPEPLIKLYSLNSTLHVHNTRQINNPHVRYRRTQLAARQINHFGPKVWHQVPNNLKSIQNIKLFTKHYKKYLLEYQ